MKQSQRFDVIISCACMVSLVGAYLVYKSTYIEGQIQIDQIDLLIAALFVLDTGMVVLAASLLKPLRGLLIHPYIRWALILPGIVALLYFVWQQGNYWLLVFIFPLLYPAIMEYEISSS